MANRPLLSTKCYTKRPMYMYRFDIESAQNHSVHGLKVKHSVHVHINHSVILDRN
jgi:hypothetical protein